MQTAMVVFGGWLALDVALIALRLRNSRSPIDRQSSRYSVEILKRR